jgi:hypothetical protein
MFDNFISLPIFLVSLAIGLLYIYLTGPEWNKVHVYPTPDTSGKFRYADKVGNCFEFEQHEVPCPANMLDVKEIPFQK